MIKDADDPEGSNFEIYKTSQKNKLRISATSRIEGDEGLIKRPEKVIRWRSILDVRRCFLTAQACEDFLEEEKEIRAQISSGLDYWCAGGKCRAGWKKKKFQGVFLKRLQRPEEEIWEIKVVRPRNQKKQTRLLGRFDQPNSFVVCRIFRRDCLDKKDDSLKKEWGWAKEAVRKSWRALGLNPFTGQEISDYLQGTDYDDYPI